ncbi:MAG: hypothetical protein WBP45_11095 [Daejeonella sp.]
MLSPIDRLEGKNVGGNLSVEYCTPYVVSVFPQVLNCEITAAVQFSAGNAFLKIYCIENKLGYSEEETDTANGPVWKVSIKGVVRGDSKELRKAFSEMAFYRDFIVKVKDNNMLTRLVGNLSETLDFKYKMMNGDSMGDLRSYSFEFYGEFTRCPPIYNA